MIEQLLQNKLLSQEGAKNLTSTLQQILALRFEAHVFYQNEGEFLLHTEVGKPQEPHYLYLEGKKLLSLREIYRVLIPFHACAEEFLHTKNPKIFEQATFYDENPSTQGTAYAKSYQYQKAREAYQQEVSLDPSNLLAQTNLSSMEIKLGKKKESLDRELKMLTQVIQQYGDNNVAVVRTCNLIGESYADLGENDKAFEFYQRALKLMIQIYGNNHAEVAMSCGSLGRFCLKQGANAQALEFFQIALRIHSQSMNNDPDVAALEMIVLESCNIISVYERLGDYEKIHEMHLNVLKIELQILDKGQIGLDVTKHYNKIGSIYNSIGELKKALEFYQKALQIELQAPNTNYPELAESHRGLGLVCQGCKKHTQALICFQKALDIELQIFGQDASRKAGTYNLSAVSYLALGHYQQALEFSQKALKIQLLTKDDHSIVNSYSGIGLAYENLKQPEKALESFQKALQIRLRLLGKSHPEVIANYRAISAVYVELEQYDKAIDSIQNVLIIQTELHGENHTEVAECYYTMGLFYNRLKNYDKELEFYQKALTIMLPLLGPGDKRVQSIQKSIATNMKVKAQTQDSSELGCCFYCCVCIGTCLFLPCYWCCCMSKTEESEKLISNQIN